MGIRETALSCLKKGQVRTLPRPPVAPCAMLPSISNATLTLRVSFGKEAQLQERGAGKLPQPMQKTPLVILWLRANDSSGLFVIGEVCVLGRCVCAPVVAVMHLLRNNFREQNYPPASPCKARRPSFRGQRCFLWFMLAINSPWMKAAYVGGKRRKEEDRGEKLHCYYSPRLARFLMFHYRVCKCL